MADEPNTPKKEEGEKKPSKQTLILAILLLVAIIVIILLLCMKSCGDGEGKEPETAPTKIPTVIGGGEPIPESEPVTKDTENIYLPAYAGLTFQAGVKEQSITLRNPAENVCLVCASLILEDGTTIYQSELIEPGYYSQPITLIAPMERGIYRNVTLRYDCYTNDEARTPLNGATSKLDITVE